MTATVTIPYGIRTLNGAPVESKYFNLAGTTYTNAAQVLSEVTTPIRHVGQTFNVAGVEYWFNNGILDVDLVLKQSADGITSSMYTPYTVLINNAVTASPETLGIGTDTVLGRVLGNIQAIAIDGDLSSVSAGMDTLAYAKAIKNYIDQVITGAFVYQGGYNATTNVPSLDESRSAGGASTVKKGWAYTVTAAGSFFTQTLEVGDVLIAEVNYPQFETDWTIVNKNIDAASNTVAGIIRIATSAEAIAGILDTVAITPLQLKNLLGTTATLNIPRKFSQNLTPSQTSYIISHGLATSNVLVSVRDTASPFEEVVTQVIINNSSQVTIDFAIAPTSGKYQVTIIG